MTMVPVYRPANPVALALAESLLTESGIPYYVQNKNFSSLYPGVAIDLFTACAIMVPEGAEAEARSVLNDLVIAQDEADDADQPVVPSSFDDALDHAPLGKVSAYVERYDATLLFPIPRAGKRAELGIAPEAALPFYGADLWNAYELSWLEPGGKPCVALATFTVPATSPNIVESKSLKLYLNGFNQTAFASASEVCDVLIRDLSAATGAAVAVELVLPVQFSGQRIASFEGFCLDTLPVKIETYTPRPAFLSVHAEMPEVTETLTSHLLKSNCPVTGQPDWGSVQVSYTGKPIDREGLLKYLVSLRLHDEFHEQCVERIFMNLRERCAPQRLSVYARYTRRGGLDINPFRASHADMPVPENGRLARQ